MAARIPASEYKNVVRKRSRSGVRGVRTPEGFFASKGEYRRWGELKLLLKAKKISVLLRQERYPLIVRDKIIGYHVPDFVYFENGQIVVEDFKGQEQDLWKWKYKHFKAQYEDIIYRVIKKMKGEK